MRRYLVKILPLLFISTTTLFADPIIGESAVITLSFPWGARAAGMAETFTGIADDESAMFYNPAGLGLAPLTKKWIHHQVSPHDSISGIKALAAHEEQKEIWALTKTNDLYKFNGSNWSNYSLHIVDSGQTIEDIARNFLPSGDQESIARTALLIRELNVVYKKERKTMSEFFVKAGLKNKQADSLSNFIANRSSDEHSITDLYAHFLSSFEDGVAKELAEKISDIFDGASSLWVQFYTIKVPYRVGLQSEVNDIAIDANGRLWIASMDGLWRFDFEWTHYDDRDGILADTIHSLAVSNDNEVLISTNKGGYIFSNGNFSAIEDTNIDIQVPVYSMAKSGPAEFYLGTDQGLLQVSAGGVIVVDSTNGLISNKVSTVFLDSRASLWVGVEGGVSHFDGEKWSRFKFTGSTVKNITEEDEDHIWLATNNGAVEYIYNRKKDLTEWKVHHESNNLKSNTVSDVLFHKFDSWVATSAGISQYKHGEVRASIFFENLLPSLRITDMWHAAVAGVIPIKEYGTIGISVDQLYFGNIDKYNPDGTLADSSSAFEIVTGISYALPVTDFTAVGLTAKYFYSRLEKGESEVHSVAFDAGIIRENAFGQNMKFGMSFLNMGPAVSYQTNSKDPIPFTIRAGWSYVPLDKSAYKLRVALDLDREVIYIEDRGDTKGEVANFIVAIGKDLFNDHRETAADELAKIILHIGTEFVFQDFVSARLGYMHDKAGDRREINIGVGVHAGPILGDFGIIMALGEQNVRQGQVRFSITFAQ